jgi:hypothetical protein
MKVTTIPDPEDTTGDHDCGQLDDADDPLDDIPEGEPGDLGDGNDS